MSCINKNFSRNYKKKFFYFILFFLSLYNIKMARLIKRTENSTNAKKRGILRLLSAPTRYIKSKVKSIYKKLVKKEPKKSNNGVNNVEKLQNKP